MDSPHMAKQKQDDQLEHTYSSCVRIQDVALKTCQRRWTNGRSGEKGHDMMMIFGVEKKITFHKELLGVYLFMANYIYLYIYTH